MSRKLTLLVFTVALIVGLSGCTAATGEAADRPFEGVTLNVLLQGHPASEAIRTLTPEFEEMTGMRVNVEIIPYEEIPPRALLMFSQRSDSYDIIHNDRLHTQGYVVNDYILSLDEFVSNSEINGFFDKSDFVPAYLDACYVDGVLYGLPVYGESTFLMYRKDLFEEYGLSAPETMNEMLEAARTVQERSGGEVVGVTLRGASGIHLIYVWSGFLWAYGGQWFDADGKLDLATPEAIAATEMYAKLLQEYGPLGFANFGWQENRLQFQNGRAGMTIDATVNGAFCEDPDESLVVGKTGYAPVPSASDNQKGGQHSLAVHPLFISRFSRNPEAAFLFTSWALSKDVQVRAMEIAAHSGVSSLGAMNAPAFVERYGAFTDGMLEALSKANVDYLPTIAEANEIIDRVGRALSEVLAGTRTAQDALEAVNRDINENVLR